MSARVCTFEEERKAPSIDILKGGGRGKERQTYLVSLKMHYYCTRQCKNKLPFSFSKKVLPLLLLFLSYLFPTHASSLLSTSLLWQGSQWFRCSSQVDGFQTRAFRGKTSKTTYGEHCGDFASYRNSISRYCIVVVSALSLGLPQPSNFWWSYSFRNVSWEEGGGGGILKGPLFCHPPPSSTGATLSPTPFGQTNNAGQSHDQVIRIPHLRSSDPLHISKGDPPYRSRYTL